MSYRDELQALAQSIGSDGCTHATPINEVCCWEHDWAYATGTTPRGVKTTKAKADRRFRDCNAAHSPLRFLSPLAWVRWTAVHFFGGGPVLPPVGPVYRAFSGEFIDALAEAKAARERILSHQP